MRCCTLLLIAALFAACAGKAARDNPPVSSTSPKIEQWTGAYGGRGSFASDVVRDAAAWAKIWAELKRDAPRPLDAAHEMAVVVFLGERPTGGYQLEVLGAAERDGKCVVVTREQKPGRGMMVTEALTNPWVVAILPRSSLPVEVELAKPAQ